MAGRNRNRSKSKQTNVPARTPRKTTRPDGASTRASSSVTAREVQRLAEDTVPGLVDRQIQARQEYWAGLMPHPDDLERYNEIVPGSAADIVGAFMAQGEHRRDLERTVVRGSERRANRGQLLAYSLVGALVISGIILGFITDPYGGAALAGVGMGSGVLLYFVGGRPPRSTDDD